MGSCTDLATKPEVAKKIDKSDEPRIIRSSVSIAVPSVLGIVATEIDEVARLAQKALDLIKPLQAELKVLVSRLGALAGEVGKFLGGLANVLSLIGLLATQAQLLILNNEVRGLYKQLRQVQNIAENAAWQANLANIKADAATSLANIAIDNANNSTNTANKATNIANRAINDADTARRLADNAISNSNAATEKANLANYKAENAISNSNTAIATANQASGKADAATSKANQAISASNTNAQELVNLRAEVASLKKQTPRNEKPLVQELVKEVQNFKLNLSGVKINTGIALNETFKIKSYIRTETVGKTTYASGIQDLSGQFLGLSKRQEKGVTDIGELTTKFATTAKSPSLKEVREEIDAKLAQSGISSAKVTKAEITTQIKTIEAVNEKEFADIKKQIGAIPVVLGGVVTTGIATGLKGLAPTINKIATQTSAPVLTQAAAVGVCSTTAPGGCMNNALKKNLNDYIGAAGTAAAAANNALLLRMQGVLNAVKNSTDVIKGTTNATLGLASHATHGFAAIQKFADTAWKATHADKVLNAITTALVIHNATMLSRDLAVTIGAATNVALEAVGIKDSTGKTFDINVLVKTKTREILTALLGSANYAVFSQKIASANRIYQSSANMLNLTRNMFDSARSVSELACENTGKIGNALLEAGVVYEGAYSDMIDKVNPQNKAQRRLEGLNNALSGITQGVSAISEISSEVIETKENIAELKAEKEVWKKENKILLKEKDDKKKVIKKESEAQTALEKIDFTAKESGN
jgi:hypothetical protein